MLCRGNYHVLISISNQTLMNVYSDFIFSFYTRFCGHFYKKKNPSQQIYITPVTPCNGISPRQTNQLLPACGILGHPSPDSLALQSHRALQTDSKKDKSVLLQSIYIKGIALQSEGSAERGYKQINIITACKQSQEIKNSLLKEQRLMCYRHPPQISPQ